MMPSLAVELEQQALAQLAYNDKLIDLFAMLERTEREMSPPERESSPSIPSEFRNLSQYKRSRSPPPPPPQQQQPLQQQPHEELAFEDEGFFLDRPSHPLPSSHE